MRVMVQLRPSPRTKQALTTKAPGAAVARAIERAASGFRPDPDYEPVAIPAPQPLEPGANRYDLRQPLRFSLKPSSHSAG